ncbi:MAG: 4-(cytidine 5'-diphospho)-2-C-methyl-D-erythritol kinase [Odoribacter sp.]|nr:4-(cytidine 5'-diphospho)-2-C-methyl-D-erythritol kinase [Odoribacter sp.]
MVIFPNAKINIGLRITVKRSDGFHNLETIFYPVCLRDAIEFVVPEQPLDEDILKVTGNLSDNNTSNNLVMKAVRIIREVRRIPFLRMHLHKAIPAGAGLGGGSSDAACIIKSLNRYFNLKIDNNKLQEIALGLGSDCPFFMDGKPAFAEGRGDLLTTVKLLPEGLHLILINPGIHIDTGEAYSNCMPKQPETNLFELYNLDISEWKNLIINDFEESIFPKYPQIADIKKTLYNMGALYSSMSGSGSTVYGIFKMKPDIQAPLRNQVIFSDYLNK